MNKNNLVLVLSQQFNYEKLIVPDCGPAFSQGLGIETVKISEADWTSSRVWILDNRLSQAEWHEVLPAISENRQTKFLVRIIDPYWESAEKTSQLHFAFRCASLPNVGYLSPYQPEEVVGFLADAARSRNSFFVSPYPYERKHELDLDRASIRRRRGMALAGIPNQSIYPYRFFMDHKRKFDFRLWLKVSTLRHPGYPDLGMPLLHRKVGKSFIEWLAEYESCFLCPGRCHLEFLKYRECAYAGSCPVGAVPRTMSKELASLIVPLDWQDYRAKRDHWLRMSQEELKVRALAYREAMRKERDPDLLRTELLKQLPAWRI